MPQRQPSDDHAVIDDQRPTVDSVAAPRRTVLRGALVAGVAGPLLAACGGSDSSGSDGPSSGTKSPADNSTSGPKPSSPPAGQDAIASVSDVPKGGGLILDDPGIVITQPTAGEFKGFTNICTHQGCPLHDVTDGTINCTCHGSRFSIEDGSVVGGPAPSPLPEKKIAVAGQDISLA